MSNELILQIITIIGAIVGAVMFIIRPQYQNRQDIAVIREILNKIEANDLVHIAKEETVRLSFEQNAKEHSEINIKLEKITMKLNDK